MSKGLFYLVCIAIATPLLWVLGRPSDSFAGETYPEFGYDDNDPGEDVDV